MSSVGFYADELTAVRIAASAQGLLGLDAVWTTRADLDRREDDEPSIIVLHEMIKGLGALRAEHEFISEIGESFSEDVLHAHFFVSNLDKQVLHKARALLTPEVVRVRLESLPRDLGAEMERVATEARILRSGRPVGGDMSRLGKCLLGLVCVICGCHSGAFPVAAAGVMLIADSC